MSHQVTEVRTQQQFLDISCLQSLLQSVLLVYILLCNEF